MKADQTVCAIFITVLVAVALTGCQTDVMPANFSTPSPPVTANDLAMEDSTLSLINVERRKEGVAPLAMRDDLRNVARAHSQDMAKRDFHSHTNPDGESPWDRIRNAGIAHSSSAENIAWNNHPKPANVAVNDWMKSPGHRNNILSAEYTHTGMGVAPDGAGGFYFTQVFISE